MIEIPPLVDQCGHGMDRADLGLGTFETLLGATAGPPAPGTTRFDSPAGTALRRWCPPLLDLEPHCAPARYLARRRELGALETERRLLAAAGTGEWLVDPAPEAAGGPGDSGTDPAAGPALSGGGPVHEVVRLERLAAQIADTSGTVDGLLVNLAEAVRGTAGTAVAFSAAAFGTGAGTGVPGAAPVPAPAADGPPPRHAVRAAAGAWLAGRDAERYATGTAPGPGRHGWPTGPVLLAHLHWLAVAAGRPLQLRLGGTDPTALAPFAAATAGLGADLVLLGCYPYHRQAALLADRFPQVYADVGTAPAGPAPGVAATVLAGVLETAPYGKVLWSSGARGLPELHLVAARAFREALGRLLTDRVSGGAWPAGDARRVAALVAAGNARRVYRLPAP
ncbi:amidohydrolase [Streptomyces sp. LP05-1]|uniref:Amidohydrolase n=1 Tax=Streptomyces pyxinae TaxID=2970734 RepID=A0ABT2CIT4_9ACTN|nr:amidohydrolase [Streptomyces sp. LP05-1]MCS0637332.1 amidohydrolase [Streptomyces sp. LP05-1]